MLNVTHFQAAAEVFAATPTPAARLVLSGIADAVMTEQAARDARPFVAVTPGADLPEAWQELRAEFSRALTPDELAKASGCVDYALRIYMAVPEPAKGVSPLSAPRVVSAPGAPTVALYRYDSTLAQRTEPNVAEACRSAVAYMAEGTTVRKTDRAGTGTRGTRRVEPITPAPQATFAVR